MDETEPQSARNELEQRELALIVAMDHGRVIGREGDLPWRLSADLKRFKQLTMGHHLLMGRVTWESLGRPLPGRTSVVISRSPSLDLPEGVRQAPSLDDALRIAADDPLPFVIGGAQIYQLALPRVTQIYLTEVQATVEGDTWFPEIDWSGWDESLREEHPSSERNDHPHVFRVLHRSL